MAKVITFSRKFPTRHSRAGQETWFVQKVLKALGIEINDDYELWLITNNRHIYSGMVSEFYQSLKGCPEISPKIHTIRQGDGRKAGDVFSPRTWLNVPYKSPQVKFAPDTTILGVHRFEIDELGLYWLNSDLVSEPIEYALSDNDGLTKGDMREWFMPDVIKNSGFAGQVLCWQAISY